MKRSIALIMIASLVAAALCGCGEKVDTDIQGVNKDKGEQISVTPRNRDEPNQGR